jgi:hypothetical protein
MNRIKHILLKLSFLVSLGLSAYGAIVVADALNSTLGAPWNWVAAILVFIAIHVALYVWFVQKIVFASYIEDQTPEFECDSESGSIEYPGEGKIIIPWKSVKQIQILTTDEGPWNEDVWWLFHLVGADEPVAIPQGAQGNEKVFDILESHFSGSDMEAVIKAMGSTSNAKFDIWGNDS